MLTRIPHYLKKILQLGPLKSFDVIKNRFNAHRFERALRSKAYRKQAATSWDTIARKHSLKDFALFWDSQKKRALSPFVLLYEKNFDLTAAQAYVHNTFNILGSGSYTFQEINWHEDFRLKKIDSQADYSFDPKLFYKDIKIIAGDSEQLSKDIKLPWDLSRCQHLLVLGQAYEKTGDERYVQAFKEHIESWINNNSYLLGSNWVCPMDVGLRAVNWIIAFHLIKNGTSINEQFWQQFTCSLYDHMIYLEHNWEVYDSRTSNHYLSDLIGYLYLCYYFKDMDGVQEKLQWCYQEILKECDKQVADDGSDYEGSTRYHVLVTELFFHAYMMFKGLDLKIPESFEKKLSSMFAFIDWCNGIAVGDHDSGKVTEYGITQEIIESMKPSRLSGTRHFKNFGLSVIKTDDIHLTLRHHVYNKMQPSGHFHNDVGSITLSYKDIPILVDPGSYVYTASSVWRNYFRSVQNHSTFYLQEHEPVPFNEHLFSLDVPEKNWKYEELESHLHTFHNLYSHFGLQAHRQINYENNQIIITDWWQTQEWQGNDQHIPTCWNFTFAPHIELKKENTVWLIMHEGQVLAGLSSDIEFEKVNGWYSPEYGVKQNCWQLKSDKSVSEKVKTIITAFRLIRN